MEYQLRDVPTVDAVQWHRGDPYPGNRVDLRGRPVIQTNLGDHCSVVTLLHNGCWLVTEHTGRVTVWSNAAFHRAYREKT